MAIPQQKFRELVFQLLYSSDLGDPDEEELVPLMMKELSMTKKIVKMGVDRLHAIRARLPEIDALIRKTTQSYSFERIQTIERNVLRLGVYEMLFDADIPEKVAISEAIRLTRKFSTHESAHFINAILDTIYKMNQGENYDSKAIDSSLKVLEKQEKALEEISKNLQDLKEEESSD